MRCPKWLVVGVALLFAQSALVARAQENERPERRPPRMRRPAEAPEVRPFPREAVFRDEMRERQERFQAERVIGAVEEGRPVDPFMDRWLNRYSESHLIRPGNLNPVDDAHYSVAEIYLRKERYADCIQRLQKVIDSYKEENETVWVTRLNMGNVERRRGAVQQAIEQYKRVKGRWAGYAQRRLLATLEESGLLDEAVSLLEARYKESTDKGERLALLRRIAELYARNGEDDKAIETYDRITREFSREEMAGLVQAARDYVAERADRVLELIRTGRGDEAHRLMEEIEQRLAVLRAQGRGAEADAMERAFDTLHRPP